MVSYDICILSTSIPLTLMGSPLGPVLANMFTGCHIKNWLHEFDIGGVLLYRLYRRCVVDIFCMFKNEIDVERFKCLHFKYPNIKFTIRKETNIFYLF